MSEDLVLLIARCRASGSILPIGAAENAAAREGIRLGLLEGSPRVRLTESGRSSDISRRPVVFPRDAEGFCKTGDRRPSRC